MLKKENFVFLLFSLVSISIGVLSVYLLSHYFSIEDFGRLQFLLTLMGIGTIFYLSGFDIIIQKQIFNKNDNIVYYILKYIMPISLGVMIVVAIGISLYVENNIDVILLATIIVSIGLFDKSNAILNAKLLFKQLRYLELFSKILILILAGLTVFYHLSLENYLILFVITSTIVVLMRIFYTKRYLNINSNKKDIDNKKIIKEGVFTTISSSYSIMSNWSEKLVLGILDPKLLAIFAIGQLLPKVIKDNVKVILIPTLNTWASKGFEYYISMIKKYSLTLWLIGIIIYIVVYFLVDIVISNYFIKYNDSIVIAQLLSLPLIFKFVENVKMSSMALSKHTNIFNKINNKINTLKIILVISLIPMFEINGAILAILIVEFTRFTLVSFEYNKLIKGER